MNDTQSALKEIRAALERDSRINIHKNPISLNFEGDTLVAEGEVGSIAAKRLALKAIASFAVRQVEDRLHVAPAERREDGAIRDSLIAAFTGDSSFHNCTVAIWNKSHFDPVNDARAETPCFLNIVAEDGVVSLTGEVISLSHKRLAKLMAWWVPGVCDVVDYLKVVPPEEDTDDEITDAIRLALAKDPLVHAEQIRVSTRGGVVTLEGVVREQTERQMAEDDVWYLSDVDSVNNQIQVQG